MLPTKTILGVGGLGFVLAAGIMLNILACALFDNNWWSFFVVLAYVAGILSLSSKTPLLLVVIDFYLPPIAPIPEFLVRHVRCVCGGFCGDEEYEEEEVSLGIYDAAYFVTGSLVASGLLLPLVLAHTQVV